MLWTRGVVVVVSGVASFIATKSRADCAVIFCDSSADVWTRETGFTRLCGVRSGMENFQHITFEPITILSERRTSWSSASVDKLGQLNDGRQRESILDMRQYIDCRCVAKSVWSGLRCFTKLSCAQCRRDYTECILEVI